MYDIVGKRNWYFAFSALITIPGLIFIILGGLRPSIDFTGGTVWQVHYATSPAAAQVQAALVELGYPEATVRNIGGGYLEIRTKATNLLPPPSQIPVPSVSPSVSPSASASASVAPGASGSGASSPSATPSSTPSPSATPSPSPTPAPVRETRFDRVEAQLVDRFGKDTLQS